MMPTATSNRSAMRPMISISANSRLAISRCSSSTVSSRNAGKHRRVSPRADGAALVVAEAQVRGKPAAADDRLDGAIEDVDEPPRVLAMGVAAHRGLIDGELGAAGLDQPDQLLLHDRQQRFGHRVAVRIKLVRNQPARRACTGREATP